MAAHFFHQQLRKLRSFIRQSYGLLVLTDYDLVLVNGVIRFAGLEELVGARGIVGQSWLGVAVAVAFQLRHEIIFVLKGYVEGKIGLQRLIELSNKCRGLRGERFVQLLHLSYN